MLLYNISRQFADVVGCRKKEGENLGVYKSSRKQKLKWGVVSVVLDDDLMDDVMLGILGRQDNEMKVVTVATCGQSRLRLR